MDGVRWSSFTMKARSRSSNMSSDGAFRAASSKNPARDSLFMHSLPKSKVRGLIEGWEAITLTTVVLPLPGGP